MRGWMCNAMRTYLSKKLISVSSGDHLRQSLSEIDIKYLTRKQDRTPAHEELWTVCRFLSALSDDAVLPYPIEVVHQDRPDFLLVCNAEKIGIEVTRATHPDYAWALALAEEVDGGLVECSLYRPTVNAKRPERGTRPPVTSINRSLRAAGWRGLQPERDWVQFICGAVEAKSAKLLENVRYDHDWLLVRDATPCKTVLHYREAVPMLERELSDYWLRSERFSSIFVLSGGNVFEFSPSGTRHGTVVELWS